MHIKAMTVYSTLKNERTIFLKIYGKREETNQPFQP